MRRQNIHLAQAVLHRTASAVAHDTAHGPDISRGRHAARDLHVLHRAAYIAEQTCIAARHVRRHILNGMAFSVECAGESVALPDGRPCDTIQVDVIRQRQRPTFKIFPRASRTVDQQGKSHQLVCRLESVAFAVLVGLIPRNIALDEFDGVVIVRFCKSVDFEFAVCRRIRRVHDLIAIRHLRRHRHHGCSITVGSIDILRVSISQHLYGSIA